MLNAIWAVMILLAVIYGALTGHMSEVTEGALDSAGEAISLCITMAGVVALWMGLMEIAGKAGLIDKLTKGIGPFLTFMFPQIPKEHEARGYIATNIIANILGLGWACTPAGLKAMEALAKLEAERGTPGYEDAIAGKETVLKGIAGKGAVGKADGRGGTTERRASTEMCDFLILNISSLQLIPVNMIAYRSQYGSANPASIIAPAIVATLFSTVTAVLYCKWKSGRRTAR
ncbi:MAG: nucleoside recognition protein [Acetatifactor sp.]